jgi:hypothetical protein
MHKLATCYIASMIAFLRRSTCHTCAPELHPQGRFLKQKRKAARSLECTSSRHDGQSAAAPSGKSGGAQKQSPAFEMQNKAGGAKEQSPAVELPNKLGDAEEQSPAFEMPNKARCAEEQSPALIV